MQLRWQVLDELSPQLASLGKLLGIIGAILKAKIKAVKRIKQEQVQCCAAIHSLFIGVNMCQLFTNHEAMAAFAGKEEHA